MEMPRVSTATEYANDRFPYENLCFNYYSQRLQEELGRLIDGDIKVRLRNERIGNCRPLGAWVGLSSFEPDNPDQRGFIVAAWNFPPVSWPDGEPMALIKPFDVLRRAVKKAYKARSASDEEIREVEYCTFERNPTLTRDWRGLLATDQFILPKKRIELYRSGHVAEGEGQLKAKGFVVKFGGIALISGRHYASQNTAKRRRIVFHQGSQDSSQVNVQKLWQLSSEPDYFAAKLLGAANVKLRTSVDEYAVLALLPLRCGKAAVGGIEAILGMPLAVSSTLKKQLFGDRNLIVKDNRVIDSIIVGWKNDPVYSLFSILDQIAHDISYNPLLLEALEVMDSSFRCRQEVINFVVDDADRGEMVPDEDRTPQPITDTPILRTLKERIEVVETEGAPVQFPLDTVCTDVMVSMRALAATVSWQGLLDPLTQFAQQEKLLLGTKGRRDHYLHTLKVFLLGRRFLLQLGCYDDFVRPRWILASLFHDVCYPLQKSNEWIDATAQVFIPEGISASLSTKPILDKWNNRGYENCRFDMLLRLVEYRLHSWLNLGDGIANGNQRFQGATLQLVLERNHAVLAAISILNQREKAYPSNILWPTEISELFHYPGVDTNHNYASQLFDAATAIILHDPKVWRALIPGKFSIAGFDPERATAEQKVQAVTWALAYADVIQEWGRDSWLESNHNGAIPDRWLRPMGLKLSVWGSKPETITIRYPDGFAKGVESVCNATESLLDSLFRPHNGQRDTIILTKPLKCSQCLEFTRTKPEDEDEYRSDPRGTGWGLDYFPGHQCDIRTDLECPVRLDLSWLAAIWDLLGSDCPVGCKDWWHALVGLGLITSGEAENYWSKNCNRIDRDKILQDGTTIRKSVAELELVNPNDKMILGLVKRLHGFRRIPLAAYHFWGRADWGPNLVRTYTREIDSIPFKE